MIEVGEIDSLVATARRKVRRAGGKRKLKNAESEIKGLRVQRRMLSIGEGDETAR